MSNVLCARVVDINRVEVAGITGCAQALILGLQQNNAQHVVNNVGSGGHNANVLAGTVADAPRNSLPARQAEQWSHRTMLRHWKILPPGIVRQSEKAVQ